MPENRSKLKLLDLFSGIRIGGFSLGLERTGGFETVAFCEIEEFPRKVLAKHWPKVPCYHDIRDLTAERLRADGIAIDAICGGFPCQDISTAGRGDGIEGERSGLWTEYARLIGELRPRVIFVENVAALLGRGLDKVLGDLATLGYDAEWHCIPASAVGAPHRRDRIWIVAHPNQSQSIRLPVTAGRSNVPNSDSSGSPGQGRPVDLSRAAPQVSGQIHRAIHDCRWEPEPELGRVANGIPDRSHRLKGLGNAVVPQIPELLGRAYLESIGWRDAA